MTMKSKNNINNIINIEEINPGDTVIVKLSTQKIVESLRKRAQDIGCSLILLNYGEFFFKDYRSVNRDKFIEELLN